jgi:hypothetical protein
VIARPAALALRSGGVVALVAFLMAGAAVACGGAPGRTVSLRMGGTPPNATVTIDDQIVGSLDVVGAHGVALPPGQHRVTVEAPGYLPFDKLVDAKDAPVRVDVALVPVPD